MDEQGRAVLSFIPGDVHAGWPDPLPQWMFEDEQTLAWSPSNALFRGHIPVGMLDWDSAGPGSRAWDVALSAYDWVPLKPRGTPPSLAAKASRFALFCDAYGEGIARREIFDTLTAQLLVYADFIQAEADAGDPGFAKLASWNVPADLRNDSAVLVRQQGLLFGSS
jgi:Ser/Thr protein kinase RdoA (MazF antagonist)